MKVYKECNSIYDFEFWAGAENTISSICAANKEDEFWDFIEEYFDGYDSISETELNDFVWFESDYIYEHIGLTEDGELPEDEEEEDEEEDEEDLSAEDDYMLGY